MPEKLPTIWWQTTLSLSGREEHLLMAKAEISGHTVCREVCTPVLNPKHCPPYDFGTPRVYYWIEGDKRVFRDPAALVRAARRKPNA